MLDVTCPYCHHKMKVPEKLAGRTGPCPKCKERIRIPDTILPPPPPVAGFTPTITTPVEEPSLADEVLGSWKPPKAIAPPTEEEAQTPQPGAGASNWALRMQAAGCSMTLAGCFILFFLPAIVIAIIMFLAALGV